MFLSIIIPVYNAENYLEECLDSCLTQNLPSEEYEIICVNDGSTDSSGEILRRFAAKHSNVQLIEQENGGISRARNAGLDAAQGDYVWFVDSDDYIWNNCLAKLHEKVLCSCADKLVFDYYEFEDALTDAQYASAKNGTLPHATRMHGSVIWDALFRRSFLLANNIRFCDDITVYGEDFLFRYQFNHCTPNVVAISDIYYFYRRNNSSVTRSKSTEAKQKYIYSTYKIAQILIDYVLKNIQLLQSNCTDHHEICLSIMPDVREITIAAKLPKKMRREIMDRLSANNLFPFWCYRRIRDWFPKKNHMNHAYMGLKGKIIDILFFYSTTRIGFAMLLLYNKLYTRIQERSNSQ